MRRRLIFIAATAAVALAAGCSSYETPTSAAYGAEGSAPAVAELAGEMQPGGMMPHVRDQCPLSAEAVQIEVSDTDNGVALTFITTSGEVADLRPRARYMAEMYTLQSAQRAMMGHQMDGDHGRGMVGGVRHGLMPAATATVEDVEGGARILLVPVDPSLLESLREHARRHGERMQAGECPMLDPE